MAASETQLLAGAQCFDLDALAEIYDRYQAGLYFYALRQLGDTALAEECVAETFLRLLKALRAGQGPQDYLQAYLYRIAHNWICDQVRRQPPPPLELDEQLISTDNLDLHRAAEQRQLQEQMRAALARLSPDQRQVVMLRFLDGWSLVEVAAALGKPVGAVKSLQHRALLALKRLLVNNAKGNVNES